MEKSQINGKEIYEKYLEIINSKKNVIIELELLAFNYNVSISKLISILQQYIDTCVEKPDFAILFDEIKKLNNPNEYLSNLGINPDYLKQHLKQYLLYYKPSVGLKSNRFCKVFETIIKNYESYLKWLRKTDKFDEAKAVVEEFIKSEYGIERFSIKYNYNIKDFKSYIALIKKDYLLYKRFRDNFELKEKIKYEHIEDDISVILDFIYKLKDEFCVIDLFEITKFGPIELITFADEYLQGEDLKLFRKYIGKSYRNYFIHGNFMNNLRIENLINTKFSITIDNMQIETTKDFRNEVVNYLREKDIPINSEIFYIACVRHYKNNLINKRYR